MSDSEFAWATVYSENPVTVRRDGETEPIGVTPQTVVPLAMLSTFAIIKARRGYSSPFSFASCSKYFSVTEV